MHSLWMAITISLAHLLYLGIQPLPIIYKSICTSQFSFTLNLSIPECPLESVHIGVENVSLFNVDTIEHQKYRVLLHAIKYPEIYKHTQ